MYRRFQAIEEKMGLSFPKPSSDKTLGNAPNLQSEELDQVRSVSRVIHWSDLR